MSNLTLINLVFKTPKWAVRIFWSILVDFKLNPVHIPLTCCFLVVVLIMIRRRQFVQLTMGVAVIGYVLQDHILLYPVRFVQHTVEDCSRMDILPTGQGVLRTGNGSFPILFFHGQGGTAGLFEGIFLDLAKSVGASTWIAEYRGYGCCRGWIGWEGLCEDAKRVFLHVVEKTRRKVIVHGGSMGAAAAACLLREEDTRNWMMGLILEDGWSTWADAVKSNRLVPDWLPLECLLMSQYDTLSAVKANSTLPLLILSSEDDQKLPHKMRKEIYDASPSSEKWLVSAEGDHGAVLGAKGIKEKYVQFCHEAVRLSVPRKQ